MKLGLKQMLLNVQKMIKIKENQFNNTTDEFFIEILALDIKHLKEKEDLLYKIAKQKEDAA